jgi:hypothetical protein
MQTGFFGASRLRPPTMSLLNPGTRNIGSGLFHLMQELTAALRMAAPPDLLESFFEAFDPAIKLTLDPGKVLFSYSIAMNADIDA